jgi:hypothetical protein
MWIRSRLTEHTCPPDWAPERVTYRQLTDGGIIVCTEEEWNYPPELGEWAHAGGWEILLRYRELPPLRPTVIDDNGLLRVKLQDKTQCICVECVNYIDQPVIVPVIYGEDGRCLLERRWSRDENGNPIKVATKLQNALIAAADACSEMINEISIVDDEAQMEVESEVLNTLLAACYHIPDDAPLPLGMIDDRIGTAAVFAAVGQLPQECRDG